ncbi:MAG: LPS export ABC transporter periplasmic protein LptC [Sinobacteraceae bacterium]|nr:LPS export ABC transporter periplasmic protein LptC [Nevskiaceae bacterium]MBV9912785.1 LPS export ABC transporter periplasmic protein LptC [Nevskiaceae bacterium]
MIFRVLIALLVVALIAGSFWLGGQQREPAARTTVDRSIADLGYAARNASLIETGADGRPMYTLTAEVIRQHPDDGVDFDKVHMTFRDAQGQIWTGRANTAELTTATGKVELDGDVHVDGRLPGSAQDADLTSDHLAIDTRENVISTDEPVVVTTAAHTLKSQGMVAALKEHQLVLESNVHGTFLP